MNRRKAARAILILAVVGTLVSAEQVSSESVFTSKDAAGFERFGAARLTLARTALPAGELADLTYQALAGDTVETFDVDLEEEKGPGITKQLVIFAIVTAAVGYAVIVLLNSDDEKETTPSGKEPPTAMRGAFICLPFSRLP